MSDTPETDAAVVASGSNWSPILRETCRRLERERDDAKNEIKRLRYEAQQEAEHHDRMVKELEDLYDKLKS